MKICMIAYAFYDIDRRIRNYSEALVEQGVEVDVVALKRVKGEKRHYKLKGVNVYNIQKRKYNEKNIIDYFIRICSFFLNGSLFLTIKYFKHRYEVIHIHNVPDFLVFMAVLPKLFGAKIIFDIHDILPEFYCEKFGKSMDSNIAKLLLFLEKISVRFADHLIVANHIWLDRVRKREKIPDKKSHAILNYPKRNVNSERFFGSRCDRFRIIYPGTISHLHGIDIAVKAMRIVREDIPSLQFLIYGRSGSIKYYKYLEMLIKNLKLSEIVKICDVVKHEEIEKIYSNIDVGIVPKRGGIFASEAFSTKIFDFMTAGIPIIASKTKIDEYYFDDSMVMFFEPENHKDMARCIIELYKNPKKGESLVNNARNFIAGNNWEEKKEIYLDLVDSLVGKNQR